MNRLVKLILLVIAVLLLLAVAEYFILNPAGGNTNKVTVEPAPPDT